MTLHEGSRLVGSLIYNVDDLMLLGDEADPLYLGVLETIRGLYDWGSWEKRDGSIEVGSCHSKYAHHSTQTTPSTRCAVKTLTSAIRHETR